MSEMDLGSGEPETPADRLNTALVAFTGCIGEGLLDVCSYGLTIGDSYVPFDPDDDDACEEGEVACTQAWVRVDGASIAYKEPSFAGDEGCAGTMTLELEVGILRCLEIPEGGEAPTATEVLVAAMQAMEDMNSIYDAAMQCEVWASIESGAWVPQGPQGGQYGGTWSFTVELG